MRSFSLPVREKLRTPPNESQERPVYRMLTRGEAVTPEEFQRSLTKKNGGATNSVRLTCCSAATPWLLGTSFPRARVAGGISVGE